MRYEKLIRIPTDRIGVLIGKSGNTKRLIEEKCLVNLDINSQDGEVIIKTKNGLKLFDLGSAIDLNNPKMMDFLKRDINNITNVFVKRGLTVENPVDVIARITK